MGAAGLADQLQLGDHLCWTFDNDDHRWNTTAELIAAGIDAGHKVLYLTDLLPPPALLAGLDERGVPARHAERVGQFEVLPAQRAYLSGGRFDPDRVLGMLSERIEQAGADGYPGLQVIGDMGWAVADPPDADLLTRYESEANRLVLDGQALAICVYD